MTPQIGISSGNIQTATNPFIAVPGGINQLAINPALTSFGTANGLQLVPGGANQFLPNTSLQAQVAAAANGTSTGTGTTTGTITAASLPFLTGDSGGYYGLGANTTMGPWLHGIASIVRAHGLVGLARSEAAVNYATADSIGVQTAQQLYALRSAAWAARKSYWDSLRRPTPTTDQINETQRRRRPERLSPGEMDPVSGQLSWPSVLQEDEFGQLRSEIDRLFARRATQGQLSAPEYLSLDESIDMLRFALGQRIREYPTDLFLSSDRFLRSVAYEALLSPARSASPVARAKPTPPPSAAEQAPTVPTATTTAARPDGTVR
jgi:hypothetical protein